MNIIEVKNLTKYYGKYKGIEKVSFDVKEGEIFGFIGPNGAGKSTTIRTLLNLIHPTNGTAKIFDKDTTKEYYEILKDVGYVPGEVYYYDDMRVIDLLNYSSSFYKKDCRKKIKELAKLFDLNLKQKIETLSYGNKKKVGIIQALIHSPKLLILDEPTSGLDPLIQQKFYDLLKEENRKGVTIFFSSHVLSEVQKICDRVAIIKDGRIIKIEEMSSITNNNYKKIRIDTNTKLNKKDFNIKGINNLIINNNEISFIYKGDINIIINKIKDIKLNNLSITDPDLEEIFMHYYSKDK
ncbi:MAG TPA: ABC transporter ATP-binding protein [Bacilli bacterium]|nr:ABC transporter ATP-binding protein [Bacilli bacterium]